MSIHIKKIKFTEDYRCFKKDQSFELQNLNLLVGDQGCGKSTILEQLRDCGQRKKSKIKIELSEESLKKGINSFYFDFEKDNPRIKDPQLFTNVDGTNKGIGFRNALAQRFSSHGESLVNFSVEGIKKAKDAVVILDEPESSLSLRNQYRMIKEIEKALERNVQFLIATHCYILINNFSNVLSLEHMDWMSSREFIINQLQ